MGVNTVTFQQSATILNSIVSQVTGKSSVISTEADFISVAQTALSLGKDAIINALSNVLSRTVFVNRPYSAKMKGLEKDLPTWGAYMRKLAVVDSDWKDNDAYKYPVTYDATQTGAELGNGLSVDPWIIRKREVQQTNFLGQSVFSDFYTIFDEQFETAFTSSAEFGAFIAMIATDMQNKLETVYESISRYLVNNFIAGVIKENNSSRVVKLLTLYNAETGMTGTDGAFTATSIKLPDNYPAFCKWAFAKIASIANMFTERSVSYQTTISSKYIPKHTPYDRQKMYILGSDRYAIESRVIADTFHENYLNLADVETVNFWQGIETPDKIIIKPTYTNTSGEVVTSQTAVTQTGVFGTLFDEDVMGWARIHQNVLSTGVNPRGEYRNIFYNCRFKTFTDFTEKGCVFLLA